MAVRCADIWDFTKIGNVGEVREHPSTHIPVFFAFKLQDDYIGTVTVETKPMRRTRRSVVHIDVHPQTQTAFE